MNFPLEKYKFYTTKEKNKVIAVSTYAGKTVKGVAKLDPRDEFDEAKGKELAAARCNVKVTLKRLARAEKKWRDAETQLAEAERYRNRMLNYYKDSIVESSMATNKLIKIEAEMKR